MGESFLTSKKLPGHIDRAATCADRAELGGAQFREYQGSGSASQKKKVLRTRGKGVYTQDNSQHSQNLRISQRLLLLAEKRSLFLSITHHLHFSTTCLQGCYESLFFIPPRNTAALLGRPHTLAGTSPAPKPTATTVLPSRSSAGCCLLPASTPALHGRGSTPPDRCLGRAPASRASSPSCAEARALG